MDSLIFGTAIASCITSYLYHHRFEVTLCENSSSCEYAVKRLLAQNPLFVGMDCEWKPARKKKESNPIALVQLCHKRLCVIIRMLELESFPPALIHLLSSKSIIKCGVGTDGDAKKLFRDHELITNEYLDVRFAYKHLYNDIPRKSGLASLTSLILDRHLAKDHKVVRSDWSAPLSRIQIEYASQDAKASYDVLSALIRFGCSYQDLHVYTDRTFKVKRANTQKFSMAKKKKQKQFESKNLESSIILWQKEYQPFAGGDLVRFCNKKLEEGYESFHKYMVSEGRIAIFKVPPVMGAEFDHCLFGLRYLEWNDRWRCWWGRNASGSFFWLEDNEVVCLKHTLIRAPEVMGKLQFSKNKFKTQDFKNAGKTDHLGSENVDVFGSDWSLPRVVSAKVNGLCIGVTCIPRDSPLAKHYTRILEVVSNPFVEAMRQCAEELKLEFIPVLCSSFTLIVADEIWGYITTCLLDCILQEPRPESPPDMLELFKRAYSQFLTGVASLWREQPDEYKQEILCLTFEFVVKGRMTLWGKCKEELDLDYAESGLFLLGMRTNVGHSMGKWIPFFKIDQNYWQAPPYWFVDNPRQLENLQNMFHRFTMNEIPASELPIPTNIGTLSDSIHTATQISWASHVEGFMIFWEDETVGDWNMAKLKLPMYYQAHYFQRNDFRFLRKILELPFDRLRHFPRLRSLRELYFNVSENLPKAFISLQNFSHEALADPEKFELLSNFKENSRKSFLTQKPDVQLKMLINVNERFLALCLGILQSCLPVIKYIEFNDSTRILRKLLMRSELWHITELKKELPSWFAISAFHYLFGLPNLHEVMRSCKPGPTCPIRADTA